MTQTNYTLLSCIESKILDSTRFYGRFALGNFTKGQGLTVANSLRRALLSQVVGVAICFVEIKGVTQEYESIPGVRECVLDLLLNLRQIILRSDIELFHTQMGYIHVKGPGIVRVRDLKLPYFLAGVDPNQYIATLSSCGQLTIKLLIGCGKTYLTQNPSSLDYENQINQFKKRSWFGVGYRPSSQPIYSKTWSKERDLSMALDDSTGLLKSVVSKKVDLLKDASLETKEPKAEKKKTVGYFPIDAIFAPVLRVNYSIEATINHKEKVSLEVWTNGSIDPRQAIHQTTKALIELFLPLQMTQFNPLPNGLKTGFSNKKRIQSNQITQKFLMLKKKQMFRKRIQYEKNNQMLFQPSLSALSYFQQTLKKIKSETRIIELKKQDQNKVVGFSNRSLESRKSALKKDQEFVFSLLKSYAKSNHQRLLTIIKTVLKPKKKGIPFKLGFIDEKGEMQKIPSMNPTETLFGVPKAKLPNAYQKGGFLLKSFALTSKPIKKQKDHFFFNKETKKSRQGKTKREKQTIQLFVNQVQRRKILLQRGLLTFKTQVLESELNYLQLPSRIYFALKNRHIHTIEDLIHTSKHQLCQIEGIQSADLKKIQKVLKNYIVARLI